jgi:UDP-N-acetylglucosamine:LPS N-acetylglucosamine transferase
MLKNFRKQFLIVTAAISIMAVMTLSVVNQLVPVSKGLDLRREDFIYMKNAQGIKRPPKILIYNTRDGSSSKMAEQAILERLPDCEIEVVDIYSGPLKSGKDASALMLLEAQSLIRKDLIKKQPDCVISCLPDVNQVILQATKELKIPFLVVPTDLDVSCFVKDLDDPLLQDADHFKLAIAYDEKKWDPIFAKGLSSSLKDHLIYDFAYPTRLGFSKKIPDHDLDVIKKTYQIASDEHLILMMMGDQKDALVSYAKTLASCQESDLKPLFRNKAKKLHLLCLCGDENQKENKELHALLNALNTNEFVRIQACFSTPKIAEIVSLKETLCVIANPKSSTINEMIQKKVPMIYHTSETLQSQEVSNIVFGETYHLGKSVDLIDQETKQHELIAALIEMQEMKKELQKEKPQDLFSKNLRATIKELILKK